MQSKWLTKPISSVLEESFAGDWGSDGTPNATIIRATDMDDDGNIQIANGAKRKVSSSKIAQKKLRSGDIILEASGGGPEKPVGRVAYFSKNDGIFLSSNFFKTLRPNELVCPRFLSGEVAPSFDTGG